MDFRRETREGDKNEGRKDVMLIMWNGIDFFRKDRIQKFMGIFFLSP